MDEDFKRTIAIIGGGICGVASAKAALEHGLIPTVFEKREEIGGVWSKSGYTWNTLIGNSSRYMGQFSDLEFSPDTSLFAKRTEVISYMQNYIDKFGLAKYIKTSSEVKKIAYVDEGVKMWRTWKVEWLDGVSKEVQCQDFDYLIISTGFYNEPNLDAFLDFIKDPTNDEITFLHSMDYKENSLFKDKNVLLVGCSYSSTQIAAEIALSSKSIVNVFRRPSWILPRVVYNTYYKKDLPIDFSFFTLQSSLKATEFAHLTPQEKFMKQNQFFSKFSNQNSVSQELYIDENSEDAPLLSVSDDYLEAVERKRVTPLRGAITNIKDNIVTLNNGTILKPDIIIFSTGFKHVLPNMDEEVLKSLHYDQNNQLCPLNLYNSTFHPVYKNLAFVGVYKGLFLGTAEIQSKYALNYLMGKNTVPLPQINEHLKKDLELRNCKVQPQYANGGYVNFLNTMAREMNLMPDVEKIKSMEPEIYEIMMNSVAFPPIYLLNNNDETKRKEVRITLMKMKQDLNLYHIHEI